MAMSEQHLDSANTYDNPAAEVEYPGGRPGVIWIERWS